MPCRYDDAALCQGTSQQLALPAPAETIDALELKIWPNPAEDVLVVEADQVPEQPLQAVILDVAGRALWQTALEPGQSRWTLLLPPLPAGWYMLKLQTPQGHPLASDKFVVGK